MTNFAEIGPVGIDKATADLQRADLLFFMSFRFSQGDAGLQQKFLNG